MTLTKTQLRTILTNMRDVDEWHALLVDMLPKYDITSQERIAGFLAQTGHESSEYRVLIENLNYSASALNTVFGKYFGSTRNANDYARQPEKIANVVYANRMGNGSIASGDGWKYRGKGVIQLTGKNNHSAFAKSVGMSLEQVIPYMLTKKGALHAGLWFWKENNLNSFCDKKDIVGMTERINGGTNGLKHRETLWNRGLVVLKDVISEERSESKVTSGDFPFDRYLRMGDKGEPVRIIQRIVKSIADGHFGPNTKLAVQAWQRRNKLTDDGIIGPATWKTMAPFAQF